MTSGPGTPPLERNARGALPTCIEAVLVATSFLAWPTTLGSQSTQPSRAAQPAQVSPSASTPATPRAPGPPVRQLTTARATSSLALGAVNSVRELPRGRLLVNDGVRKRLLLLDSALGLARVVLDSSVGRPNSYGTRAGALIPYLGDSSLFVDPSSLSMLVIDGEGTIVGVRSIPRVTHALWMASSTGQFGWPGVDGRKRLVYRIPATPTEPAAPPPKGVPYIPSTPDSAFVVAVDLASRAVDTLGSVRIPKLLTDVRLSPNGEWDYVSTMSPLPLVDDWAVLADGTVVIVRGRDYRVEFLDDDGERTASGKLPFPWVALSDDDKARMTDSVSARDFARDRADFVTSMIAWSNVIGRPYPRGFTVPAGYSLPRGIPRGWTLPPGMSFPDGYVFACAPGASPPQPGGTSAPECVPSTIPDRYRGVIRPPPPTVTLPFTFPAAELPDYRPPFGSNAVRADRDGQLWIRTIPMTPNAGGVVYDVVSRAGVLVDRVQIPPGVSVAGFGAGGTVFLASRAGNDVRLSRADFR